jgi:hypothetical protein
MIDKCNIDGGVFCIATCVGSRYFIPMMTACETRIMASALDADTSPKPVNTLDMHLDDTS